MDGQETKERGSVHQKYGWSFKRQVVKDYLEGNESAREIGKRYGIKNQRIFDWIKHHGKAFGLCDELRKQEAPMTTEEQKEFERLRTENARLQEQLKLSEMKGKALEIMVEIAKEELGVDIRKNFGARQPKK